MSEGKNVIWKGNFWYTLFRPYVDLCTRFSYRKIEVEGTPHDGAVIFSPNHTNTVMDALVILRTKRSPTVFGARGDVFNNPTVEKILRFLRILPMVRQRDKMKRVIRNSDTFKEVDDSLAHGVPFCIFPEGRHHLDRTILPLHKGLSHIAVTSALLRQTYIQPIGIVYDDFLHYRSRCRVRFGEMFDVNAFLSEQATDNENEAGPVLLETIQSRMQDLVREPLPERKRNIPLAVLTAPFALLAALLTLPMWVGAEAICRRMKDIAFSNTARYSVKLLGTPLMFIIWAVVFFVFLPWYIAAGLLVYFLFSYSITYDWWNLVRK